MVLTGIAVALLFTWLLLFIVVGRRRPRDRNPQLEEAYRRF
jgi:hypothetical protein